MEFDNFLKVLWKHKYLLIILPLITIVLSYLIMRNLADKYVSTAQIATGIIDQSRHLPDKDQNNATQEQQISQQFSNLIEIMKLNKLVNQVSYQLILHDLTDPVSFKSPSKLLSDLNADDRKHAIAVFTAKFNHMQSLSFYNRDENNLNELLRSMKYDERSLRKNLIIVRDESSDFITVSYESGNPQLSAFAVNVLCKEFINYYTHTIRQNETDAVAFLANLLNEKRNALEKITNRLQEYRIRNGVLNLEEQSKSILNQVANYNERRQQAQKDEDAYNGAIRSIEKKFEPEERQYLEASMNRYNQAVTSSTEQLHALTDKYVRSNFSPGYKLAMDSVTNQLNQQINATSDKYVTSPLTARDALVQQRLTLEVQRDLAKYSKTSIAKAVAELNSNFNRLVPFDARVKTYNFEMEIASKEYLDVLNRYNDTNLRSSFSVNLNQVENAVPDAAEPSKKILLVLLSGVIMLALLVMLLFVRFFFDKSIKEPVDLVNRTGLPLLGYLPNVEGAPLDLRKLWDIENRERMRDFKELIRSIRFEVDQELKGEKILGITSLGHTEGKTVLAISLAYSYAMINKKVLLIDGHFNNNTISKTAKPKIFLEDYLKNSPDSYEAFNNTTNVIGNYGGDITLLEISNENFIRNKLGELKLKYDIIIIDTPPVSSFNKAKEWLLFANKTIAVFEANNNITKENQGNVNYLKSLNGKFAGWILNKTDYQQTR